MGGREKQEGSVSQIRRGESREREREISQMTPGKGVTMKRDRKRCAMCGCNKPAPGTASVYKMRLRADPHRSQITERRELAIRLAQTKVL